MAGIRCVGLWPSPPMVASLGAQSCISQAYKRQSQGTACPQEAGEGEGSPVWQSHVPKSLRVQAVCNCEGEDSFLEDASITYVLVDYVKQKQKEKQLCYILLEVSSLSLSHNSPFFF